VLCGVLQCVAWGALKHVKALDDVCCSVLQHVAACCSVLQRVAVYRSRLQRVAVGSPAAYPGSGRGVLQCVTVCCSRLWCFAVCSV